MVFTATKIPLLESGAILGPGAHINRLKVPHLSCTNIELLFCYCVSRRERAPTNFFLKFTLVGNFILNTKWMWSKNEHGVMKASAYHRWGFLFLMRLEEVLVQLHPILEKQKNIHMVSSFRINTGTTDYTALFWPQIIKIFLIMKNKFYK